jgi:hypothetical protein
MRFPSIQNNLLRGDKPFVVMHFDINKTIIISDPASGVTADQMLNSILSECIWGTLKRKSNIMQEKLRNDLIGCADGEKSDDVKLSRSTKTEAETNTEGGMKSVPENVPQKGQTKNDSSSSSSSAASLQEDFDGAMGGIGDCYEVVDEYGWSLDEWTICHPHPSPSQPQDNSITFGEFIENYNFKTKMTKKEMKYCKNRFTEKGMAGESVINHFKILQDHLKFPRSEYLQNYLDENSVKTNGDDVNFDENKEELTVGKNESKRDEGCEDKIVLTNDEKEKSMTNDVPNPVYIENKESTTIIENIIQSGYYHIIPSFFKLISYFHENDVDFRIIFRTFGSDIENVKEEFNVYCEGNHPLFPVNDVLNKRNIEKNINIENENLNKDSSEDGLDGNNKNKSEKENEERSKGKVEHNMLNHSTVAHDQTIPPLPTLPSLQGIQAVQGIPEYTVRRVKMDGSHGIGVDRRLSSPYYSRVIQRSVKGSEGTRLVRTDTQGVSTVYMHCVFYAVDLILCKMLLPVFCLFNLLKSLA